MSPDDGGTAAASPLDRLRALATSDVDIAPGLRHVEIYTLEGLLTVLWHDPEGRADAAEPTGGAVVLLGGAMGGLLGPSHGLYHRLGEALADGGTAVLRVSYRTPNHLQRCVHDALAVTELAVRSGARRFAIGGHSFGGAVAVQTARALGDHCGGLVTFATQSAGCEGADELTSLPVLAVHGDRDELLPVACSELLVSLTGGELLVLPGEGHLLAGAGDELAERLAPWLAAATAPV